MWVVFFSLFFQQAEWELQDYIMELFFFFLNHIFCVFGYFPSEVALANLPRDCLAHPEISSEEEEEEEG